MAAGDSGDVSAEVHIEVTGISSLQDASEAVGELEGNVDDLTGSLGAADAAADATGASLDGLGDAAAGIEADAAAAGHLRDNLAEIPPEIAAINAQMDALGSSADLDAAVQQAAARMQGLHGGDWQSRMPPGLLESLETPPQAPVEEEPQLPFWMRMQKEGLIPSDAEESAQSIAKLQRQTRDLALAGDEAASALGSGGLGGSLDDVVPNLNALRNAEIDLVDELTAGEVLMGVMSGELDAQSASAMLDAGSMDALAGSVDLLSGSMGAAGGGGGFFDMLDGLGPAADATVGKLGEILNPGKIAMWGGIATLIGGAVSVLTPFTAGLVSFGALGAPALKEVYDGWEAVSTAQKAYAAAVGVEKHDPTADNLAAQKTALAALKTAYDSVPASVRPAISAIHQLASAWEEAGKQSGIQADVLRDIPKAIKDVTGAIPAMSSLGKSFAPEFSGWLGELGKWEKSGSFKSFIGDLDKDMGPASSAIGKVGDAIGGLVDQLTKPSVVKSADAMFSGIAGAMKSLTPAAVDQLQRAEDIISGASKKVQSGTQPGGFLQESGRFWDDFNDVNRNLLHYSDAGMNVVDALVSSLWTHSSKIDTGNFWRQTAGYATGTAKPLAAYGPDYAPVSTKLVVSGPSGTESGYMLGRYGLAAGDTSKVVAAATSQGKQAADAYKAGAKDVNLANLFHPGSGDPGQLVNDGRKAGEAYKDGVQQAVRDINFASLMKTPDASGIKNLMGSGKLKVPAELDPAALQNSAKNVKIHGATVDLSDAKLSGLSALAGTLDRAARDAGKDYDTALGSAIASDGASAVAKAKAVESAIKSSMSGMSAAGMSAGEALGNGLATGIEASTGAAVAAATAMANAVTAAVRTAHQTASPSKVFKQIGRDDVLGLIMGLEEGKDTLAQVVKDLDPTKALKHLITTAEHYARSLVTAAESGSSLSTLYGETQAGVKTAGAAPPVYATMGGAMKASLKQIKAFDWNIKELKKEGLSKKLLDELIKEGPSALPEARSILAGGKGGIDRLDDLEKQIEKWSDKLARTGTDIKYGRKIGSDVAAGMAPQIGRVVSAIKDQRAQTANINITMKLDGKVLGRNQQTVTLQHAGRNTSSGLKLPNRGA